MWFAVMLVFWGASYGGFEAVAQTGDAAAHIDLYVGVPSKEPVYETIGAACEAARKIGPGKVRTILIGEGDYFLDAPILLTDADSNVIIGAAEGAKVTLYGGAKVGGWTKDGERFYAAELEGVKEGSWDFRALVVNGRYCPRARLPEEGTFTHLSKFDVPWMSTTGGGWKRKPTEAELTTLEYREGDLGQWLDVSNAEMTVYHMWDESLVGVESMDSEARTLKFSSPTGHPAGAFGVKKYIVWNVREGMTKPGQWYLDRTAGKVVYWPLPGEDMGAAVVYAPRLESIIRIEGRDDRPARNIVIRGIGLSVTTTPLRAGGFGAGRFDGAIQVRGAENCVLEDLEVFNIGGQGIKASGRGLRIEGCHVHDTGACGIRTSGDGWIVSDSHIHDVGLTYPSAIGLAAGGSNSRILHNEIHDTPYTAVNCGGTSNRIEGNLIYNAMKVLHDGAGIYCFAGKNLVLRGNFIRDIIDTGGYGASAYYLDERSEGCVVEGNLSLRVVRPSHNHMAKNNTIRNNVFVNDGDLVLTFPKSSEYTVEKNVLSAGGKISFENPDGIAELKGNILFSKAGKIEGRKLRDYAQIGMGDYEVGQKNSTADPLLRGVEMGRIAYGETSPAGRLGLEPIDVSMAGVRE